MSEDMPGLAPPGPVAAARRCHLAAEAAHAQAGLLVSCTRLLLQLAEGGGGHDGRPPPRGASSTPSLELQRRAADMAAAAAVRQLEACRRAVADIAVATAGVATGGGQMADLHTGGAEGSSLEPDGHRQLSPSGGSPCPGRSRPQAGAALEEALPLWAHAAASTAAPSACAPAGSLGGEVSPAGVLTRRRGAAGPPEEGDCGTAKRLRTVAGRAEAVSRGSGKVAVPDPWEWRKYGQKQMKDRPYRRDYYRCSHRGALGCPALKHVNVHAHDAARTYVCLQHEHSHAPPLQQPAPVARRVQRAAARVEVVLLGGALGPGGPGEGTTGPEAAEADYSGPDLGSGSGSWSEDTGVEDGGAEQAGPPEPLEEDEVAVTGASIGESSAARVEGSPGGANMSADGLRASGFGWADREEVAAPWEGWAAGEGLPGEVAIGLEWMSMELAAELEQGSGWLSWESLRSFPSAV